MVNKPVIYRKQDHTGYITLNKPQDGNRIDEIMTQEIMEVCSIINEDPEVYLAIITGAGESFCLGGDIKHLELSGQGEKLPSSGSVAEAIAGIDRPTITALNGDAIGEGLELALACDLRVSTDKAHFGLPQITEGRIPVDGGTQRLSRIVGKGQALEMVLTGKIIDAPTAFEIGLVNIMVSSTHLVSEIESIAKTLAGKAPIAMRYAKEAVNSGLDMTLEQGLRLEADLYFLLHTTSDRTEGITSYLQKRPPQYKGK